MKRPPIADSIGQPHHQKNNMNPAALERLAKYSVYPVKSAGFLMRKSSYYRRDFYCLIMGCKARTNMRIFSERNSRFLAPSVRHATTNAFGASSTAETVGLFLGCSAVIGGGIFFYSHHLKDNPIFKKALDVMNHSPLVHDLMGTPSLKVRMARGRVKNGEARITFVVSGRDVEYLVYVEGVEDSESHEVFIKTLSLHKRAQVPAQEYFIYRDGDLVVDLSRDQETNVEEILEGTEESDEVFHN